MKTRGTTAQRGYGYRHRALRQQWQDRIDAGEDVRCWRPRCGRPIRPGQPWQLGHDDDDRTVYRGPECVACNERAGAWKTNAIRRKNHMHKAPRTQFE